MEGKSVARGIPILIQDYLNLDSAFFCSFNVLTEVLNGDWNFATREFHITDEKVENYRLEDLENEMNAK